MRLVNISEAYHVYLRRMILGLVMYTRVIIYRKGITNGYVRLEFATVRKNSRS